MGKQSREVKKAPIITVREMKEIESSIEVYQLSPNFRYVITIERPALVESVSSFRAKVQAILQLCKAGFIPGVVITNDGGSIKFFEFEETKVQISDGALAEDIVIGGDNE